MEPLSPEPRDPELQGYVEGAGKDEGPTSSQHKGPLGDLSATTDRFIHYFRGKGIC